MIKGFLASKNSSRSVVSFLFFRVLLSMDRTRLSFSVIDSSILLPLVVVMLNSLDPCITANSDEDDDEFDNDDDDDDDGGDDDDDDTMG